MELLFIDCQFQKLAFDSEYEYLKQWDQIVVKEIKTLSQSRKES